MKQGIILGLVIVSVSLLGSIPSLASTGDPETDCVKSTAFFYGDWLKFGKPACWCYPRNCRGDADGFKQGNLSSFMYVYTNDLNILILAESMR